MATTQLPPDFKEFLQLLNSKDVEYLLVGGQVVSAFEKRVIRPVLTFGLGFSIFLRRPWLIPRRGLHAGQSSGNKHNHESGDG